MCNYYSCVSAELVKPAGPVRVEYHMKIVKVSFVPLNEYFCVAV